MSLEKELTVAVCAAQTAVRIDTDEIAEALSAIMAVAKKRGYFVQTWDRFEGLRSKAMDKQPEVPVKAPGALEILYTQPELKQEDDDGFTPNILVMSNFHLIFEEARDKTSALIQHLVEHGKAAAKYIVAIMPPEAVLPPEIAPLFHRIVHELPDEDELHEILDAVLEGISGDAVETKMTKEKKKRVCMAALGLTRLQAEGVFSASLVAEKAIQPEYVWKHKSAILNREGLVELRESNLSFADVGGLHGLKNFLRQLMQPDEMDDDDPDVRAKGVVVVGPPGVGKSLIAECTGKEFNLPILAANPGNLMGGYVGDTERNTRKFFQILKVMAPCVVIMDEVGKNMPTGSDDTSGVGRRLLGTFLTAMNDMKEKVFWFFTENSIEAMHEAFTRAERVDAIFYVKLPSPAQRAEVWKLYLKRFFPETIKGKKFSRHVNMNVAELISEIVEEADPDNVPQQQVDTLSAALLTTYGDARATHLANIRELGEDFEAAVVANMVDDSDWTPAEIRSCCRLSRRLRESLKKTEQRIRPIARSASTQIAALEKWALSTALDAETGTIYTNVRSVSGKGKAKRSMQVVDRG